MNWFSKSNPLSERVRSPFYGSFIISWIVWNWRIILTVLFLKKEDFGSLNLIEYIATTYLNIYDCVLIPLALSAFFLLILPWIDYFIVWHAELNKRMKIDRQLEVGKKYKVSGEVYYNLKTKYENERKKISELDVDYKELETNYKKESQKNSELNEKIDELNNANQNSLDAERRLSGQLTTLKERSDASKFFNGRWTRTGGYASLNPVEVEIYHHEYRIFKGMEMKIEYTLRLVDFDPELERFKFAKYKPNEVIATELRIINNDRLEGTENDVPVIYTRGKLNMNSLNK